jgi:dihydroorotate dehydrogenase
VAAGVSGIIATNTTLDRGIVSELNRSRIEALGDGGLSGRGLRVKAQAVQRRILQRLTAPMRLVASGGIGSGDDALQALQDGAALVQVYSALIFEGPGLISRMNEEVATRSYF